MSSIQLAVMGLDTIISKKSGSGSNTSIFSAFYFEVCFRGRQVGAESQFALHLRAVRWILPSTNVQPSPCVLVQSQPHPTPLPLLSLAELCSSLKSRLPVRKQAKRPDASPAPFHCRTPFHHQPPSQTAVMDRVNPRRAQGQPRHPARRMGSGRKDFCDSS